MVGPIYDGALEEKITEKKNSFRPGSHHESIPQEW